MDTYTYSDKEYIPNRSTEEPVLTSYGGGMFTGSQHFTIDGGTFNNHMNHYHAAPVGPPDFRMIPIGDIDLQRELVVNGESSVIDRQLGSERHCVRRVYSAKIDGRSTDLTVTMYEGDGAEEAWQKHVKMYMSLRHPNIVQMYGTASSGAMYATIFNGDLIPIGQFMASASPIMTVYTYACYVNEWQRACDYVKQSPYFCDYVERSPYFCEIGSEIHSTLSIRRSNGRLCADFDLDPDGKNQDSNIFSTFYAWKSHPPINPSLDPTSQEAVAIHSLTFEAYHHICVFGLRRLGSGSFSPSATISSGAVVLPPNGQFGEGAKIASLPDAEFFIVGGWSPGMSGMLQENDWTRFNTEDVFNDTLTYTVWLATPSAWLTQASHIFSRLQITSNLEEYALMNHVEFQIIIGNMREDAPSGYLFLCPTINFQTGPSSFRWPDCPAYWSLDPSGGDRLSTEEAKQRGFPSLQLNTQVHGYSWDASVYAGLRQFHQAKGFDPDSQDVARHLRYPLFQLSGDTFAHADELSEDHNSEDCIDDGTEEEDTNQNSQPEESAFTHEDAHEKDREHSSRFVAVHDDAKVEGAHLQDALYDGQLEGMGVPTHAHTPTEAHHDGPNNADLEANLVPQVPNDRGTGRNFIHRFFWGLQQGIKTRIENVDADTISPFLV